MSHRGPRRRFRGVSVDARTADGSLRPVVRVAALASLLAGIGLFVHGPMQAAQVNPPAREAQAATGAAPSVDRTLFTKYCVTCHNQALKTRGTVPVAFDTLDLSNLQAAPETWEKIVLKMRAGLMPPAGSPRPDRTAHDAFVTGLETELDRLAAARPNPGRTEPFHRLNRAEYRNAIRDLLDIDVDVSALLPADDASYGFDNIAGVLKISPTLMERYLVASQKISRLAVGTPPPAPAI